MDSLIETRCLSQIRADAGRLVGYAVVYDKLSNRMEFGPSGFFEKFDRGAFTKSLNDEDDVRALREHDPAQILGRTTNGTLRLAEDSRGVRVDIEPPATQVGRETLELVRRGDLSHMSFRFQPHEGEFETFDDWAEQENGDVIRTVHTAKLLDVSVVAFPAYSQSSVSLRSLDRWLKKRLYGQGAARARQLELQRAAW